LEKKSLIIYKSSCYAGSMTSAFIIFLTLAIGGSLLEKILDRLYRKLTKKKYRINHFAFSRYIYLLLMPIIGVISSWYLVGSSIITIFITFSLIGPFFEWIIGYAYNSIVGQRLWTYHRYAVNGYTSLLTIPFWGLGGVLFYFLARII
jgi:uncharacterized membrane protein